MNVALFSMRRLLFFGNGRTKRLVEHGELKLLREASGLAKLATGPTRDVWFEGSDTLTELHLDRATEWSSVCTSREYRVRTIHNE